MVICCTLCVEKSKQKRHVVVMWPDCWFFCFYLAFKHDQPAWLFTKGTRVKLTSGLTYKTRSSLYRQDFWIQSGTGVLFKTWVLSLQSVTAVGNWEHYRRGYSQHGIYGACISPLLKMDQVSLIVWRGSFITGGFYSRPFLSTVLIIGYFGCGISVNGTRTHPNVTPDVHKHIWNSDGEDVCAHRQAY